MVAFASSELIAELETAVRDGTPERRSRMLRFIADLFASDASRLNPSQIRVFDDVLVRLIQHAEPEALSPLSDRLAGLTSGPEQTARSLAQHESAVVATPILLKSKALSDANLVDCAKRCSEQHLQAIAARPTLSGDVTDVVLERADGKTLLTLARNAGARFSDKGYGKLVAASERDDAVAESLAVRPDLPAAQLHNVLTKASPAFRNKLLAAAPPEATEKIQTAIQAISARPVATPKPIDYAPAMRTINELNRTGKLNDLAVSRFASQGDQACLRVALSVLSGAPMDTVELVMKDKSPTGVIVASRASRLSWPTTLTIIDARGAPALTKEQIEQSKAYFNTLYVSTAQYTIRFEPPVSRPAEETAVDPAPLPKRASR
jgi:uncharacterized protein (DUF2336 family)